MASPTGSALLHLIGHKRVRVKPQGTTPYEHKLRFKGEPRFDTIPMNEKPKISRTKPCNNDSTNTSKGDALSQRTSLHQNRPTLPSQTAVPFSVPHLDSSSGMQSMAPQTSTSHGANQDLSYQYLNEAEAYFHMLKTQNWIFIDGECGSVVAVKEYEATKSRLHMVITDTRRPLYTFYQTWCDVHLDYGNHGIQDEFSYSKLLGSHFLVC